MKKMKIPLLLMMLFSACFAGAQQRYELSAKQAADFARQNNQQVKNALLDVEIFERREVIGNVAAGRLQITRYRDPVTIVFDIEENWQLERSRDR